MDETKIRIDLGGPDPQEFPLTLTGSRERLERVFPQLLALIRAAKTEYDLAPTPTEKAPCSGCGG